MPTYLNKDEQVCVTYSAGERIEILATTILGVEVIQGVCIDIPVDPETLPFGVIDSLKEEIAHYLKYEASPEVA